MNKSIILATLLMALPLAAQTQQGWSITQNRYAPWQADDKRLHYTTGIAGGIFTTIALDLFHVKRERLWWYSLLIGLGVGLAKECWDRHHGGSPELMDAVNTALGFATPGTIVSIRW